MNHSTTSQVAWSIHWISSKAVISADFLKRTRQLREGRGFLSILRTRRSVGPGRGCKGADARSGRAT
jgi:hypothetical protein